jgi:hypothetical protein
MCFTLAGWRELLYNKYHDVGVNGGFDP